MNEEIIVTCLEENRQSIIKSFKRWITQTAREERCYEDEVIHIIHNAIDHLYSEGNLC